MSERILTMDLPLQGSFDHLFAVLAHNPESLDALRHIRRHYLTMLELHVESLTGCNATK